MINGEVEVEPGGIHDIELAERYLRSSLTFEEMIGFKPSLQEESWGERVFFSSLEEAWPGAVPFEEDIVLDSKEWDLVINVRKLNEFFEKQDICSVANIWMEDSGEKRIVLTTELEGEEYLCQKIEMDKIPLDRNGKEGLAWKCNSLVIVSIENGGTVLLDGIFQSQKESNIRWMISLPKGLEWRALSEEGEVVIPNPIDFYKISALFHEEGHSREFDLLDLETWEMLMKARKIFERSFSEKMRYTRNMEEGDLTVETAHKIVVKMERRAWAFALKALKEINEKSKLNFGNKRDRKEVMKYAEGALETYDQKPLRIRMLKGDVIPAFTQKQRAEAIRVKQLIERGVLHKEELYRQTFNPLTNEYRGANIQDIK